MDLDDVEHKAFVRRISQPPKWLGKKLFYLQLPALKAGERRALKIARKAFICSDLDKQYLAEKWGLRNLAVIPNSIHIPDAQDLTDEPVLLFLGAYGYRPNALAAEELVSRIWPRVRQRCPTARLLIAGANPEFIPTFGTPEPGVEYTGFAEDLDSLYSSTRVVCCPIRAGGGTRIKIIEAAAYGKPIVSTRIGAEGLDFIDGDEIFLRDDAQAFADACVDLIMDKNLSNASGRAARAKAEKMYERRSVIGQIQREILG
jgi:glycosyltransferase involved in cell wall biosynthesis